MAEWVDGWMVRWMDGWTVGWLDECIENSWLDWWMDDGWTVGWTGHVTGPRGGDSGGGILR